RPSPRLPGAVQAPVRGGARARAQGRRGALGRGSASGSDRRGRGGPRAGRVRARVRAVGPARPQGKPRDVRLAGRGRAAGPGRRGGGGGRGRAVMLRAVTIITHSRPDEVRPALDIVRRLAVERDITLRLDQEETRKHGLQEADGVATNAPISPDVDLCVVLGGDGTILSALRRYVCTRVPVFAVNYGEVGFLATRSDIVRRLAVERDITLRLDQEETRKHGLQEADGVATNAPISPDVDLCVVLGGDGTILSALRRYVCTRVPVFAVNYGEVGFLAT